MNTNMKNTFTTIFTVFFLITSAPILADEDHDKAKRLAESGDILELEVILQKVRMIQPGKVLEVELETKKGKMIYEIELLDDNGKVFEFKFDAQTGQHISTEEEN